MSASTGDVIMHMSPSCSVARLPEVLARGFASPDRFGVAIIAEGFSIRLK